MLPEQAASLFDAYYFRHGCGPVYERSPHWLEFFGGIAVLLGIFTRYAALGFAIAMTVSTLTAKLNV